MTILNRLVQACTVPGTFTKNDSFLTSLTAVCRLVKFTLLTKGLNEAILYRKLRLQCLISCTDWLAAFEDIKAATKFIEMDLSIDAKLTPISLLAISFAKTTFAVSTVPPME
mmetsp:Transcript_8651/g.20776  ORF Transcript_8651/g.20776 Transcript_8651/m.20776 type:complete len:112 (-) Transcript_8651:95-430(-)